MHKSRLCSLGIDFEKGTTDLATAADFWSAALGRPRSYTDSSYAGIADRAGQPIVFVQEVDHPSRVHLDIETDDIEAEVARLEALGAKRVKQIETWWIMEAPTGHRFCVVRVQRDVLGDDANQW